MLEIKKVSIEVVNNNPVRYEIKTPYEQTDDYGNVVTLYRKDQTTKENLESQKASFQTQIDKINEKLEQIAKL